MQCLLNYATLGLHVYFNLNSFIISYQSNMTKQIQFSSVQLQRIVGNIYVVDLLEMQTHTQLLLN